MRKGLLVLTVASRSRSAVIARVCRREQQDGQGQEEGEGEAAAGVHHPSIPGSNKTGRHISNESNNDEQAR